MKINELKSKNKRADLLRFIPLFIILIFILSRFQFEYLWFSQFSYQSNYIKRLTMIIERSIIKKVFYPIASPKKHIIEVLEWLKIN